MTAAGWPQRDVLADPVSSLAEVAPGEGDGKQHDPLAPSSRWPRARSRCARPVRCFDSTRTTPPTPPSASLPESKATRRWWRTSGRRKAMHAMVIGVSGAAVRG